MSLVRRIKGLKGQALFGSMSRIDVSVYDCLDWAWA